MTVDSIAAPRGGVASSPLVPAGASPLLLAAPRDSVGDGFPFVYNVIMTPTLPRNAVALLIGIGYGDRPGLNPLRFASRDARALARVVADPRACAFPPDKVALLTDAKATRAAVVRH